MGLGFLPELTEPTGILLLGAATAEQWRDTAALICMLERARLHIYSMGFASTLSYLFDGA